MSVRTFVRRRRPPSQVWWCEIIRCRGLARVNTPLGAYCAKHSAALVAHFGWTDTQTTLVGRGGRSGTHSQTSPLAGVSAAGHDQHDPA